MDKVVYLTAAAEDRCRKEVHHADMIEEVYGDWEAAERIRERAYKRLEPYRKVWWRKEPVKQEGPENDFGVEKRTSG